MIYLLVRKSRFRSLFLETDFQMGNSKIAQEEIWRFIAEMETPRFFITAEMNRMGDVMPKGLETFIRQKLELIHHGLNTRRFVFQEGNWRIYLTFFPTTEVVSERYALKNKVVSRRYNEKSD